MDPSLWLIFFFSGLNITKKLFIFRLVIRLNDIRDVIKGFQFLIQKLDFDLLCQRLNIFFSLLVPSISNSAINDVFFGNALI